ncbi:MAG: Spy/CpxP family protein refolding chaperone [Rhodocyclaceae bacterium]|jgi:hypothetical protein|nr:Spy/CpxP family protein refolding chaperone [Rhodocyclaceae bacterium]MCL4756923.1 Spy/CpxP family protein refolding chaperone [Rhodocyclaceae bacterium]
MKSRTMIVTALAAALVLGGGAVLARGGDCEAGYGSKAGWGRMSADQMQERMADRSKLALARLELALALTPEQKPAWETFRNDVQARASTMAAQMKEGRQDRPQTALERMQRMEERAGTKQAELAAARKTVETFYATLSDAQKTVFDAEFMQMERGHGGGRHGMMRHGRGQND